MTQPDYTHTHNPDLVAEGRRYARLIETALADIKALAINRRGIIKELHHKRGYSYSEISKLLGISRSRIQQIAETK